MKWPSHWETSAAFIKFHSSIHFDKQLTCGGVSDLAAMLVRSKNGLCLFSRPELHTLAEDIDCVAAQPPILADPVGAAVELIHGP